MNHKNYGQRLEFIRSILHEGYNLEPCKIEPIEYDPDCPFAYNNFVYRVELPSSIDPQRNASTSHWKPGTVPLPADASTFVIRLSNPAAGLNDQNRVENEVATMSLFRHALSHFPVQLVPAVYDWASAANGQGWILQEYMNGRPLDKAFEIMSLEDKKELLMQMAEILYALQHYQLPSTIKEYGGLTFDEAGNIISAPMTLHPCGPFQNYEELYTGILQSQLATVEANPWVKGWRLNGVRERLDNFISKGLGPVIRNVSSHQKILVHGDFTTNNLLFDEKSQRITAILGFDWAMIGSIAEEFFRSFGDIDGKLPGPYCTDPRDMAPRKALLEGFPDPLPSSHDDAHWEIAKAWDDELARKGIQRPRTIRGIDALSGVYWLSEQICPFLLCNEVVRRHRTEEQLEKDRINAEGLLTRFLEDHGF